MEVHVYYSQSQLDSAADFISQNNQHFLGKYDVVYDEIVSDINRLIRTSDIEWFSTMGFILKIEREFESMDCDENIFRIEIYVDPSIHLLDYSDDNDQYEEIINI